MYDYWTADYSLAGRDWQFTVQTLFKFPINRIKNQQQNKNHSIGRDRMIDSSDVSSHLLSYRKTFFHSSQYIYLPLQQTEHSLEYFGQLQKMSNRVQAESCLKNQKTQLRNIFFIPF